MSRIDIKHFQDIPNVGKVTESFFYILGINEPIQLVGRDPYEMYSELCNITQKEHDPCVIDVFISSVKYMEGGPPKKWWEFTEERKNKLGGK